MNGPVPEDEFVDVATADSVAAAQAAVARLKEAGIDARLRRTQGSGEAEAVVMAPAGQLAAARDLLGEASSPDVDQAPAVAAPEPVAAAEPSAESIAAGLERIRRRRRIMWFWFFSYIPAAFAITVSGLEPIVVPLVLCWLAGYLLSGALAESSRCPRCGGRYCQDETRWDPYTQECLNCGLALHPVPVRSDRKVEGST